MTALLHPDVDEQEGSLARAAGIAAVLDHDPVRGLAAGLARDSSPDDEVRRPPR